MAEPTATRSLLVKPVSGDCNLHCDYCFYHERPTDPYADRGRHIMRADVLDALIRQGMALERGHAAFGWQGGEPTLAGLDFFRQVVALQQHYGAKGQAVSNGLQTNGLLLNAEWAGFLRSYQFLLGVSLDGPASYHDRYRHYLNGEPTHARVMRTLRLLQRHEVAFNVLAVVNRVTADHGAEIYEHMLENDLRYLQFIPCVERAPDGSLAPFSVGPEQYGDFLCAVFDRWYNGGRPEASVRDFESILSVCLGREPTMCCYQETCGDYLVVEHNGDVYPCDFFVEERYRVGNLLATPLESLFASEAVRAFAAHKAEPRSACAACPWLAYCHQGCPRMVNVLDSEGFYLCRATRRFLAHSLPRFHELAARIDGVPAAASADRPGRNDPCPCGSGKKYKQCCGRRSARP
ncbi:MAG: anaerobic sulfatase maturase [Anaerolineae bacterium]